MLLTRITERLGIRYPVMSAPMSLHSGGRLAAAVSKAGGLGMFGGVTPAGPDWVREQIRYVRSQTDKPFGVGFITNFIPAFPENLEVVLKEQVSVVAFSFGDPQPYLARAKEGDATVLCQVQTLEGAKQAVDAGADALVAQGNEAGGHTGTMNLLPFLARVVEAFPNVPVLAAGGIATGRTLAAALAAGADGAWVGTAFLATPEAVEVPDSYKERIVASDGEDTVFTEVFDIMESYVYGIPPWPEGIAGRAYNNTFAQEWHGREAELRERAADLAPAYTQALERRDPDVAGVLMGQSAAFVSAVRPAADVLHEICDDAERILRTRSTALLQ